MFCFLLLTLFLSCRPIMSHEGPFIHCFCLVFTIYVNYFPIRPSFLKNPGALLTPLLSLHSSPTRSPIFAGFSSGTKELSKSSSWNVVKGALVLLSSSNLKVCFPSISTQCNQQEHSQTLHLRSAHEEHFLICFFLILYSQFFLTFPNLDLRVDRSPTWEGPGYAIHISR